MSWFICCIADTDHEPIVHWLLVNLAINKTSKPTVIRFKPREFCHLVTYLNAVLKKKPITKENGNRYLGQQSIIFNLNIFSSLCSLSIIIHYVNNFSKTTVRSTLSDLKNTFHINMCLLASYIFFWLHINWAVITILSIQSFCCY